MAYKRRCKYCKRVIEGLSETQMIYNLRLHEEACERNTLHSSLVANKEAKGRRKKKEKDKEVNK